MLILLESEEKVSLSHIRLSATPWTVAHQAPLSMEFSHKNPGVGSHSFLQGIFPTQGLNLGLLNCRQILYHLSHQGSPAYSPYQFLNLSVSMSSLTLLYPPP